MLTITQLAKAYNLSRTTLLYYERQGLLMPANRSENGYRWYGDKEQQRLQHIVNYRSFGVPIAQLKALLERQDTNNQQQVLECQFHALGQQIQSLKQQQQAILALLEGRPDCGSGTLDKARWSEIMVASGMSDTEMANWHTQFERLEPQAHQQFLESLGIPQLEITRLRKRFSN
ncbi:MerR family transcriptional regulator [Ferrimonas aestuarii]|uniref:MerR family transcriptional regulator n=1 Tax=Ferrimonas aestuarii TaxID=2569539 RepID=A0A4U1BKA9_9GAMM|nr:MerR family transcriptional regulator [Ferrimonas aestuarii]TKB51663.1 MerR family transcriptional regulator [Ferrimonas aestuarii]